MVYMFYIALIYAYVHLYNVYVHVYCMKCDTTDENILYVRIGYLLLGVLPPKIQDYSVMYDAIFRHLQNQGLFSGFPVEDAAGDVVLQRIVQVFVNNVIEDVDGIPHPTCCKKNGSENGSCPFCKTLCKKINGRPCYIGAAHHLRLIQLNCLLCIHINTI